MMSSTTQETGSVAASMPAIRRTWLARFAAACVPLLPLVLWLVLLPRFGVLQYDDYYDVVHRVSEGASWSSDFARWLAVTSNEHHVPLPTLLYWLNWLLFDGSNRSLAVLVLVILGASILALRSMLPETLRSRPLAGAAAGFLFAAIVAGPDAAAQVVKSFAGTMWLVADAFALGALAWTVRRRSLWPVLLMGAGAAASYSTSLALWPALLIASAAGGRARRQVAGIAALGVIATAVFFATYQRPVYHPALETRRLDVLIAYVLRFLGGPLTSTPEAATLLGGLMVLASVLAAGWLLGRGGRHVRAAAPWWGVQVYALGNGVMAGVARAGMGLDQGMTPRYLPLASLFTIAMLGELLILALAASRVVRRRVAVAAVAMAGVACVAAAAARGAPVLEFLLDQAARHPAAAWALRQEVWDEDLVESAYCGWPEIVLPVIPFLRDTGHVPFDRPLDRELGTTLSTAADPTPAVGGSLDFLIRRDFGWVRVEGWAFAGDRKVREVVIVDGGGVIRGKGFVGFPRPDVARAVAPQARLAGFVGFARAEPGERLRAFARVGGSPEALPLNLERVAP